MPDSRQYNKYCLLLDPKDKEDQELIKYLKDRQTNKRKNSYSAILRSALKLLMEKEK